LWLWQEEQYLKRVEELDRITELRDQQRQLHDDYRKMRLGEFMEGFGIITHKLKEMYRMITLGGDAELELVDSLDPFSEGIVFR
jgi:structural maintenance of chromosome 4